MGIIMTLYGLKSDPLIDLWQVGLATVTLVQSADYTRHTHTQMLIWGKLNDRRRTMLLLLLYRYNENGRNMDRYIILYIQTLSGRGRWTKIVSY